ncbi:ArsR/SmtB family transcription factor [Haloimpatiens lingqiaonensis]|uniref:ArsR/SmtB family transcription factor n=1 Tax=Haloimpatiens lingqiaonensis TaxID=1380675 RepID=UPI0010FE4C8A|nr:metalloregulator ArsR/SmtB family transcription factor [Haloimpatiens lingqiaonensis]
MDNKNTEICSCYSIHEDALKHVKNDLPKEEILFQLADFFKIFGDSTRLKILYALSIEEMCVCDISNLLNMSQSAISHQLKTLRQSKLVKFRRDGKVVYYSLDDDHIRSVLKQGFDHVME